MRVVFLLGVGISLDLLPLSRQLTAIVHSGKASDGREVLWFRDAPRRLDQIRAAPNP